MRKTESQKIALCGMLGALSVVLLLLGSALQIGTYAAPMLAAFLLIPVLEEYGTRYALTLYVCVAILAVLFVPETELALFYVLVMGYYPVLRVKLNGVKSTLLRWVLKFAVFNAGTVLVYLLLFALLGPAVLDELLADGVGMLAALLAAGNLSFWLCDRALAALTRYYHVILKPKLKKKFNSGRKTTCGTMRQSLSDLPAGALRRTAAKRRRPDAGGRAPHSAGAGLGGAHQAPGRDLRAVQPAVRERRPRL